MFLPPIHAAFMKGMSQRIYRRIQAKGVMVDSAPRARGRAGAAFCHGRTRPAGSRGPPGDSGVGNPGSALTRSPGPDDGREGRRGNRRVGLRAIRWVCVRLWSEALWPGRELVHGTARHLARRGAVAVLVAVSKPRVTLRCSRRRIQRHHLSAASSFYWWRWLSIGGGGISSANYATIGKLDVGRGVCKPCAGHRGQARSITRPKSRRMSLGAAVLATVPGCQ